MSRKMRIAVLDRESIGFDTPLEKLYTLGEVVVFDRTEAGQVADRIRDVDVILINKVKITRELIFAAEKLRLICIFATGYDNVDVEAARERGVAVCNVPGYSTDSVTVFTVATVLSLLTRLREYNNYVASGEYSSSVLPNRLTPVFNDLSGKAWGIVGCGAIGSSVAAVASAFGSRVITYQRHRHPTYETVDLDTLCRECDVITVHCPLNEESRGLIGRDALSKMKKSVILVNSARGAVLDECAVAEAIKEEKIGAFGCDVYSSEPFDERHPYYAIKSYSNVLLTPHSAWGSYEARVKCIEMIYFNIRDYFMGKITNRVDITKQN